MNPQEVKTPQIKWLTQLADDMGQLNSDKIEMAKEYYSATGLKSSFGLVICQMFEGVKKSNDRALQAQYKELRNDYIHYLRERIKALQGKKTTLFDPWALSSKSHAIAFPAASCHLHDVLESGKLVGKYHLTISLRELDQELKELVHRIEGVYQRYLPDSEEFITALLNSINVSRKHFTSHAFEEGMTAILEAEHLIQENS